MSYLRPIGETLTLMGRFKGIRWARSDSFSRRHGCFRTTSVAVLLVALMGTCFSVGAQPRFGALTGVIKDQANVPVAGATITAVQQDGGTVRGTISNSEGVYSFGDLAPGTYSIVSEMPGYLEVTVASLQVVMGRAARADIAMTSPVMPSSTPAMSASVNQTAQNAASPNNLLTRTFGRILEPRLSDRSAKRQEPVLVASLSSPPVGTLSPPAGNPSTLPGPTSPGPVAGP